MPTRAEVLSSSSGVPRASHLPLAGADSRSAEAGARGAGSQSLSGIHAKPTHNSRSVQCIADASLGIIARRHVLSFVEIVAI